MTKDKDSRPVIGGISGRAGKAPGDRGAAGHGKDTKRPPEKAPRPIVGRDQRGGRGGGNSN